MTDQDDSADDASTMDVSADTPTLLRRGALTTLASLGILGLADTGAAKGSRTLSTTLEYGQRYTNTPPSNYGLWLEPPDARWAVIGKSSAPDGRGVLGQALATTGNTFGVLGRSASPFGVGFEGNATAATGNTVGVRGQVNSPDGYGLATPNDARIDGDVATTSGHRVTVDGARTLRLESTKGPNEGFGGNVVHGHPANGVGNDARGATIGGGGYNTIPGGTGNEHKVWDDFGTVAGGEHNTAGSFDFDRTSATHATVGGGANNVARATGATVSGGTSNVATGTKSAVGGGALNSATATHAVVSGGDRNTARGDSAGVLAGVSNAAKGLNATIGGGDRNTATADWATVAGGRKNDATAREAFVGGGDQNEASGDSAGVLAGAQNVASGKDATVAGGEGNTASGRDSFAVGREATAQHDGAVVVGDSTSTTVSSARQDEVRIQQAVSKEKVGAKMVLSSNQTITSDANEAQITFDSVRFDDFGWADTNNYEFTVSGPATLKVGAVPAWEQIGKNQDHLFRIKKGGSVIAERAAINAQFGIEASHYMQTITRIPDGTTQSITMTAVLFGLNDRELSSDGENVGTATEFWVIKEG